MSTTRDVAFPPKDEPLRLDVGALGELVGDIVREQGGDALFELVEQARRTAIRRREGIDEATDELQRVLRGLSVEQDAALVRAFSTYFQVVNLAERTHRVRRGRWWMRSPEGPQSGSIADTMRRLKGLGLDRAEARRLFDGTRIEPVFTAHPTESTRRAILDKQESIARELVGRIAPERTPREERIAWARIREEITIAWQTDEHPTARPSVADEREHVLYYVTRVLYRLLPALHEAVDEALDDAFGGSSAPANDLPPLIQPGSWVGGDMDGNPNVDADTLRNTLRRQRSLAVGAYLQDVRRLSAHLTQTATRVAWSSAIDERTKRYADWFPSVAAGIPARHAGMGYRIFLELVAERLRASDADHPDGYSGPRDFLEDVELVADSLRTHQGAHAGLFMVRRLLRRIRAFGFHLASLDVRQDARALRDAVAELRDDPAWPARAHEERSRLLRNDLEVGSFDELRSRAANVSDATLRELEVFRAIRDARTQYGPAAIANYIISMAQDTDDVLTVLWLNAVAGAGTTRDHTLGLDVAPLFETVPDLDRAEDVLERMYEDPIIRPHLDRRDARQLVMVGYSDSNKDGGIASARWALQRALDRMARVSEGHGITLTVFHGRGGTVSRGGGSVERAVRSMPAASIGGRLRLTEQGEVIDAKYGLPEIALRELERMLGSVVLRAAEPGIDVPPSWHAMADTMATAARTAYRALVYEDPAFLDYFRSATPIDVIERMAIGSRPASRRDRAGVEDLRAIPWVFAWTQCRSMLTGWYGLGTGLEAARREHGTDTLCAAAASWPFFDALLADVEMVLAKADLEIAEMYRPLAPEASHGIFHRIQEEFDRTVALVLELRKSENLLDADPTLQRSIRLRNPYVDPMNILQVDLLGRWREAGRPDGPLFDALLATVNGIARGLQNTG